jgi:hypothetical protein
MNLIDLSYKCLAIEGSTIVLMARLQNSDGTYTNQAAVTSISVEVDDISGTPYRVDNTGAAKLVTDLTPYESPAVASVISNTLTVDSRWTKDATGFNLAYKFKPPLRDHTYQVRITLLMANGDTLVAMFEVRTR